MKFTQETAGKKLDGLLTDLESLERVPSPKKVTTAAEKAIDAYESGEYEESIKISTKLQTALKAPENEKENLIARAISGGGRKLGRPRVKLPSLDLGNPIERWNAMAGSIGMQFLDLWNNKTKIFLPLIAVSILAWALHYLIGPTVITLQLAIVPTLFTLILAMIGLIVIEHIETTGDFTKVPSMVTQTLIAVIVLIGIMLYLGGMMMGIAPAPPLPILLAIMFAIPITPWVTLAVIIPPLIGYASRFRAKWVSLRRKYPFWGIYLGLIAGALTLYIPIAFIELLMIGGVIFRIFVMGGALVVLSIIMAAIPTSSATKITGIIMIFMSVILWFGASGGMTLGSILAAIGGAHAYSWEPASSSSGQEGM